MTIDFKKSPDGLVPAIVQDFSSHKVLMLGYMNQEALDRTMALGRVTFFSRSKNRLWTKGEESGHYLELRSLAPDCDHDTILVKAIPHGPVCHTGADTCWSEPNHSDNFLQYLEGIINLRKKSNDEKSYVHSLFQKGINKIAQKVGEEAVEMVIEAKDDNEELFLNEGADLLFHYLILLNIKGYTLQDVINVLQKRHAS
jgi:phosphoribosyl-ATP pyrophosphohydrolase/phosphoribosyl-AMP cyclohydrolase